MATLEQRLRSVGQHALARDAATLEAQKNNESSTANYWFNKAHELLVTNELLEAEVARLNKEAAKK